MGVPVFSTTHTSMTRDTGRTTAAPEMQGLSTHSAVLCFAVSLIFVLAPQESRGQPRLFLLSTQASLGQARCLRGIGACVPCCVPPGRVTAQWAGGRWQRALGQPATHLNHPLGVVRIFVRRRGLNYAAIQRQCVSEGTSLVGIEPAARLGGPLRRSAMPYTFLVG
jgi:hypothetical protein